MTKRRVRTAAGLRVTLADGGVLTEHVQRAVEAGHRDLAHALEDGELTLADLQLMRQYLCAHGEESVRLRDLLRGASFAWVSSKSPGRQLSAEELAAQQKRKAELYRRAEKLEYNRLVKDVDPRIRAGRESELAAGATVQQGSFGLFIIVCMIGGFIAGYMLAMNFSDGSQTIRMIGGLVGLVASLVVETTLFILRAEKRELLKRRFSGRKKQA